MVGRKNTLQIEDLLGVEADLCFVAMTGQEKGLNDKQVLLLNRGLMQHTEECQSGKVQSGVTTRGEGLTISSRGLEKGNK